MGKIAVFVETAHAEIDGTVRKGIGKALFLKGFDYVDDSVHIFGGAGVNGRLAHAKTGGVGFVFADIALRKLRNGGVFFGGTANKLVVNIGEVLYKGDLVSAVFKIAAQHVKNADWPRVADVNIIIYRGAAGVNFKLARCNGHKLFLLPGHCVKNFHILISPYEIFFSFVLAWALRALPIIFCLFSVFMRYIPYNTVFFLK